MTRNLPTMQVPGKESNRLVSELSNLIQNLRQAIESKDYAAAGGYARAMLRLPSDTPRPDSLNQIIGAVLVVGTFHKIRNSAAPDDTQECKEAISETLALIEENGIELGDSPAGRALERFKVAHGEEHLEALTPEIWDSLTSHFQSSEWEKQVAELSVDDSHDSTDTDKLAQLDANDSAPTDRLNTAPGDTETKKETSLSDLELTGRPHAVTDAFIALEGSASILDSAKTIVAGANELRAADPSDTNFKTRRSDDRATPLLGAAFGRAMLRKRSLIISALVTMVVFVLGFSTSTQEYRCGVSLLRAGNSLAKGTGAGARRVRTLPKETLRRLPTQPEVVRPVLELLAKEFPDQTFDEDSLAASIKSTIETGEHGSMDLVLIIEFLAPSPDIAAKGIAFLQQEVMTRHDIIVGEQLEHALEYYGGSTTSLSKTLANLEQELAMEGADETGSAGDYETRLSTLMQLYLFARQNLERARAELSIQARSTEVFSEVLGENDPITLAKTSQYDTTGYYLALQPYYNQLMDLERQKLVMEAEIRDKKLGVNHPTVHSKADLDRQAEDLQDKIDAKRDEFDGLIRVSTSERESFIFSRTKVSETEGRASTEGAKANIEFWENEESKFFDRLSALTGGEVATLTRELDAAKDTWQRQKTLLLDLEAYRGEFNGLSVVSESFRPVKTRRGVVSLVLLALFLGILAAAGITLFDGIKFVRRNGLSALMSFLY